MKKIVIATSNEHKLAEICQILNGVPAELLSLKDFPEIPPIEETGDTFEENAFVKARTVFNETGLLALGDDSGLEVEALGGAPGIYSARYAGGERDYAANNLKLLEELKNISPDKRIARFRCVVAIVGKDTERVIEGIVRGKIIGQLRGNTGFGYDPLFVPGGYNQTFAEMGELLKNKISHRAKAFQNARQILLEYLS